MRVHLTGCARSEGFYKIDIKEKAKYLQAQRRQLQCQANITEKEQVQCSLLYSLFLVSSRNAPPRDDNKNGCVAD